MSAKESLGNWVRSCSKVNVAAASGAATQGLMCSSVHPELEAYAGVISALRAQGDLTKDKKDLLGELTKILG